MDLAPETKVRIHPLPFNKFQIDWPRPSLGVGVTVMITIMIMTNLKKHVECLKKSLCPDHPNLSQETHTQTKTQNIL